MPSGPPTPSRRTFLGAAGAVGAVAAAGCITSTARETTYRLHLDDVGESLAEELRWEPSTLHADQDRQLLDRLLADGSLATEDFSLHSPLADHPAYVERDGAGYRIEAEPDGEVERERWLLWFELLDEQPGDDATVVDYDDMTDGFSERDENALRLAFPESEWGPRDVSDESPKSRGHVFVRGEPDDTELLPEPPFTHVFLEWGDEEHYLRARTERVTVSLRRIQQTAERVADSADGLEEYVAAEHVVAAFDEDVDEDVREIVTGGRRYEEEPPLSDAYETVLERLGLDDLEVPDDGRVEFSDDVFFARDGRYVAARLEILN